MEDKKYTCANTPELKGCPFCGSENITIRYGVFGCTSNVHYPNETGFVACLKCGARTLKTGRAKNAVKKWNARKESNAAAPKWISVDTPPKKGGEYIVAALTEGGSIIKTWDIFTEQSGWCSDKSAFEKILFYMDFETLPEPPKEVE